MKKKVHLVLGSGGARGLAHIAVIEELEKEGFEIIEIIGCSMGAVIGGFYASGHLKEYKEWLFGLSKSDVFDLMDFTFTKQGFIKGEKIFNRLKEITGDLKIEDFEIPFTAVATDMKNNKEVHFRKGDLFKALRASVSIPGVFLPVIEGNKLLVDGGVLNPMPVNLVKKEAGAIVVAVNLNAPAEESFKTIKRNTKELARKHEIQKWIEKMLPDGLKEYAKKYEKESEIEKEDFSLLGLMEATFSFTQDRLTELILETSKPDVLISIPRNAAGTFEFYESRKIYMLGLERCRKAMQHLDVSPTNRPF
ncbi:MAG: patatin-like phospholipase family protein [Balneolaceae bacterium]|nr:patatin-like phospholipase family protein [Balneolaceae bacterium]MBO6545571.1 patatin-like phospholipase family protein [Balneolaceae bacterium]MBO6646967.1 patatin-like phospholipase family protein [Balneolaceae bacterium]